MLKDLVKIANRLDFLGLTAEADIIDSEIRRFASEGDSPETTPQSGPEESPEKKKANKISEIISLFSTKDPYERWVFITKTNKEEGEILMRKDADAEALLSEDETKELKEIRMKFRVDKNSNAAEYEKKWKRDQEEAEVGQRTTEEVQYEAFRTLAPRIKGKVFLSASEDNKFEIIARMTNKEAYDFLRDTILDNINLFTNKLKESDFGIYLKLEFMKKLAKSTDDIQESRARVKKFYNLLSDEDKVLLRESTKGGTASVFGEFGSPVGYYEQYSPSRAPSVEEFYHIYEESKKPGEGFVEKRKVYGPNPNLPEERAKIEPGSHKFMRQRLPTLPEPKEFSTKSEEPDDVGSATLTEIESVNDIQDEAFYIFQMLPRPKDIKFGPLYSWILISAIEAGDDAEDEANKYADILEERYKKKAEESNKKINESEMEGECLVLVGNSAKELISSKLGKLTQTPFEGSVSLKGPEDFIGRSERTGFSKMDPEAQDLENLRREKSESGRSDFDSGFYSAKR